MECNKMTLSPHHEACSVIIRAFTQILTAAASSDWHSPDDDDGNYYPCGDTTGYYDAQGTYHLYEAGAAATAAAEAAAGAASVDTSVASGSADAAPVVAADSAGPQAAPAPGPAPVDDGEVAAAPEAAPLLAEAAPPAEVDASGPPAPGAVTVAAAPPAMAPAPPSETSPPAPPAEPSMATGPSASSSSPYMQLVALGRLQHGCLPSVLARLAMHGAHGMAAPMHPELLDGYGTPAFAATPEAALASAPALRLELVEANGVPVPLGDASDRVAFKHRARAMLFDGTNFVGNTAELSAAMLGGADANGAAWAFGAGALQASQKRRGAPPPAPLLVRSRLAAEGAALLIELTVCYACTESEARAARGAFKHGMLVEEEVCAAFVLLPLRGLFDAHSGGLAGGARTLRLPLYTGPFDAPVQVPPTVGNAASRTGWLRRVGANSVAAELVVALRPLARRSPEELPLLPLLPSQLLLPLDERHRSLCRAIGSYRASVAAVLACDADTGGDAAGKALRRAPAGPGACLPDILDHPVLRDIFVDAWHAECTAIRRKGRAMLDEKSVMSEVSCCDAERGIHRSRLVGRAMRASDFSVSIAN